MYYLIFLYPFISDEDQELSLAIAMSMEDQGKLSLFPELIFCNSLYLSVTTSFYSGANKIKKLLLRRVGEVILLVRKYSDEIINVKEHLRTKFTRLLRKRKVVIG